MQVLGLVERRSEVSVKSVKTIKAQGARQLKEQRHRLPEVPAAPGWSLPSGRALAEFAFQSGFLVPVLMGAAEPHRRHAEPVETLADPDGTARCRTAEFPSV
jgi:hypothetical protein